MSISIMQCMANKVKSTGVHGWGIATHIQEIFENLLLVTMNILLP